MKLLWQIEWFKVLGVILVFIAGALYLAGNNLDLLPQEDHHYANILFGMSLVLGIVPTVLRTFGGGVIVKAGSGQPKLITIYEVVFHKLFPMLMFTVQLDQIYTIIVGEVTHHKKEFQDGTYCSKDNVKVGIIFFVTVCVVWIATVWSVIGKIIKDIFKFKKATDDIVKAYILALVIFMITLTVYTPGYIALDNNWPWVCVAKCQLQEGCIIDAEEQCAAMTKFANMKVMCLCFLWCLTCMCTLAYIIGWCMFMCMPDKDDNTEDTVHLQQHSANNGAMQETEPLVCEQNSV